jgi:hypothetical protein
LEPFFLVGIWGFAFPPVGNELFDDFEFFVFEDLRKDLFFPVVLPDSGTEQQGHKLVNAFIFTLGHLSLDPLNGLSPREESIHIGDTYNKLQRQCFLIDLENIIRNLHLVHTKAIVNNKTFNEHQFLLHH